MPVRVMDFALVHNKVLASNKLGLRLAIRPAGQP